MPKLIAEEEIKGEILDLMEDGWSNKEILLLLTYYTPLENESAHEEAKILVNEMRNVRRANQLSLNGATK